MRGFGLVLWSLVAFVVCMMISAQLYPGGAWTAPHAQGYSFWQNYWCDLVSPVAIGGGDHRLGAWLARAGFGFFALALWRFWPLAAALAGGTQRARAAHALGWLSALFLLGVSAVPSAESELLHGVLVTVSAGAGIVAALLMIPAVASRVDRTTRWLSWLVVVAFAVPLLQYLRQGLSGSNYADWLAGSQKLATGLLILWMVRLLWWVRRDVRAERQSRFCGP